MDTIWKQIKDRIRYIESNINEIWGSYFDLDDFFYQDNSAKIEEIFNKYFSFLNENLSDPSFIPSLKLDELSKKEILDIIPALQLFFPKKIYYEIFKYYKEKIDNLFDLSIINTKDDIDFYMSMGYTIDNIIRSQTFYPKEEIMKYVVLFKTTAGVIDKDFYDYIINNRTNVCLFLVLEELRKGNHDLLTKYTKTKELIEALLEENIPDTQEILDKILLLSKRGKCSVITDIEKAKKLITLYGAKYIVFISNPSEEVVSMIDNFKIEDYTSVEGDFQKSPHLLKFLLKKGEYKALEYAKPEAITQEIVELLVKSGIDLKEYEDRDLSLEKSLAYNKYLVSQGRFEFLSNIHDLYTNIESFDYVYNTLKTNDINIKSRELNIINFLLGKKKEFYFSDDISQEVAERIVSLGFTLKDYLQSRIYQEKLLKTLAKKGDNRALLLLYNTSEKEAAKITYDDFLSLKTIKPNIIIGEKAAIKLIKEGHYDLFNYIDNDEIYWTIRELGLDEITEEKYEVLPKDLKELRILKEKFIVPPTEEIMERLEKKLDEETISLAIRANIPYEIIKKHIDASYYAYRMNHEDVIKLLRDGHHDSIKYLRDIRWISREEQAMVAEEYYKSVNGYIPPEEEFMATNDYCKIILSRYYFNQGKYEIAALQNYEVNDQSCIEILKKRKYSIEDFRRVPIYNSVILGDLVKDGYIDDVMDALEAHPALIDNGEDFLVLLYRMGIPKDKISDLSKYCKINVTNLIIKLKDSELELLQYLNLEILLSNTDTLNYIIDNFDPKKIEKVLQRKANIPIESLNIIISTMVEKGNPSFVRFYSNEGNAKVLKKALLAGYMPKLDTIEHNEFLSNNIPLISFSEEEKKTIKTYAESNPSFTIYLIDEYENYKSIIIDCITKEPEIFKLLRCSNETKFDIIREISKTNQPIAVTLFSTLSTLDQEKLVKSSHEIVKYLPNELITNKMCEIVISDYPEVIEKKSFFIPQYLISLAFHNGYKVNENSTSMIISWAIKNDKEIPYEIWNDNNIDNLLNSLKEVDYEEYKNELDILFDGIYNLNQENFIKAIMKSSLPRYTIIKIISRYGYTSEDYDAISSIASNELQMNLFFSSISRKRLSLEEQKKRIIEMFYTTNEKKYCLEWLIDHGRFSDVYRLAKEKYESDPLTLIEYCQKKDKDEDEEFIERTKKIIRSNPRKYVNLANSVPKVLLDKDIVLEVIIYIPTIYRRLSNELKKSPDIIDKLLETDIEGIVDVPTDVPNYKEHCYKSLRTKGSLFEYLPLMHNDKEGLKIAVETYPYAINYADLSIIDDDIIKHIKDFNSFSLNKIDIEKVKKIISLESFEINNPNIITQVLDLVSSGEIDFTFDKKIAEGFIQLLHNDPNKVYNNYFKLLLNIDETSLSEEQRIIKNNAKQLLEEYGKINTLEKNKVYSYEFVKYVVPALGFKVSTNLMKYNSGADKKIINIIKDGDLDLAKAYIELIQKYHIFKDDDKLIHFAFRYYENYRTLIRDIIDKELTPQEITNLTTIIMNNNPYNIKTKEELTRYGEIIEEYIKNMLDSQTISAIKYYFATVFGFNNYSEFEKFFNNYQLDNFPQIQYVLQSIKEKYGEDFANSFRYTVEEAKVILLMKEVLETDDIDELKQLIRLGIETKDHVLDYSDIVYNITLKVRKAYNYQINANLTKIDSLKEKQKSKTNEYRKTITNYRREKKEVTYTIIDMDEEPFNFIVHRIYDFDPNMRGLATKLIENPSLWSELDGASTLSTSSISDRGFWFVDKDDADGVVYIFDELPENFLLYMYGSDLMSEEGGHTLEPAFDNNSYTDLNSLNQATCSTHGGNYNEVVGYREGVMPKAILCNGPEPNDDQIRAADYFGIPIIRVNMQKYEELKITRYNTAKENMKEKTTSEDIYDVMYNGIVGKPLSNTIDFCIDCIWKSCREGKIDSKEMLKQLMLVRQLANRISEPGDKKIIRKVDLMIRTIAIEKSISEEEIIEIEYANMGESGIMYKLHKENKDYLLKPSVDKKQLRSEPFRAEVQKSVATLQKIISPDTAVPVEVHGKGEIRIAKQEKIPLSNNPNILKDWVIHGGELDPNKKRQLLQEYVVDFLACNFDCSVDNFIVDSNENVRGIDKEQSFRFIDNKESLDPSFSYTPNGSSKIPIYQYLFNRYAQGEIDLDFSVIDKAIAIIEEMTDIEYEEIFKPYAEAINKEHPEIILEKIVQRKHICIEKIQEYIASIRRENPNKKGENYNGRT